MVVVIFRADLSSSAICVYSRADILRVFSGYFKDDDDETWKVLPPDRDPSPRLDNVSINRVATVREKVLENEIFSRSGKSQGITFSVKEI